MVVLLSKITSNLENLIMEIEEAAASAAVAVVEAAIILMDSSDEERQEELEKTGNFYEVTIQNFSNQQFKMHFRLSTTSYEALYGLLANRYFEQEQNRSNLGHPKTEFEKKLLIFLWYISNIESYRSVSDRFGVAKSTCWQHFQEIIELMGQINNRHKIIRFPTGEDARQTVQMFEEINGFPGIIGAIDGCHIRIKKPVHEGNSYINRKGFHSVLLQGICNKKKMFTDVYAGEAGSLHDYILFRKSDFYRAMVTGQIEFPENCHLIGDLAYKLSTKLMVGYKDNGQLTPSEIYFNTALNKNRIVIENTFGLLKCRFRRLKMLENYRMDLIPQIIFASCILHNFCMQNNDFINYEEFNDDLVDQEIENADEEDHEAQMKRQNIKNLLYVRFNLNENN